MTCIGITCFYLAAKTVEEDNVSRFYHCVMVDLHIHFELVIGHKVDITLCNYRLFICRLCTFVKKLHPILDQVYSCLFYNIERLKDVDGDSVQSL